MPRQHENDPKMMSPEFHQLTLLVGGLKTSVDAMSRQWERQEESAVAGRRALHEKFESFREEVGIQIAGLSLRVDRLVDTVTRVEPTVKQFEDDKLRAEGAKKFRTGLLAIMSGIAGGVGWGLHEIIGYLKH